MVVSVEDHELMLNAQQDSEGDQRFLVVKFPERAGFANRVLALTSAFMIALLTNRTFLGMDHLEL